MNIHLRANLLLIQKTKKTKKTIKTKKHKKI